MKNTLDGVGGKLRPRNRSYPQQDTGRKNNFENKSTEN